jgi:hypothetical protein
LQALIDRTVGRVIGQRGVATRTLRYCPRVAACNATKCRKSQQARRSLQEATTIRLNCHFPFLSE